jgi:hypothetical protein
MYTDSVIVDLGYLFFCHLIHLNFLINIFTKEITDPAGFHPISVVKEPNSEQLRITIDENSDLKD